MKRIWLILIITMMAVGAVYAMDELTLSDLEGIEITGSELKAIQGQRRVSVWEDGNRGYYRPGAGLDYSEVSRVEQDRAGAVSAVIATIDIIGGGFLAFGSKIVKYIGYAMFTAGVINRCQSSYRNRRNCFND